jgi:MoaA/NifB/PqqE/SkfB family radical SAM enzyme
VNLELNSVAVFLNRDCVHNCPQCSLIRPGERLSVDKWKEIFDIFGTYYGVTFYLVLGTEPLLLKDDLVKIIKFWNDNKIFYGLYSTSPQPFFDDYKYKLLDVGLNNWSCGIDGLPGHDNPDHVDKKISNGLDGLIWMSKQGVQTMSVVTLSNKNLSYADKIIEYCQENIKDGMACLNPIEWRHNDTFDFFSTKEEIEDLVIPSSKWEEDRNLDIYHLLYDKLNYRCNGAVGMGVDVDGRLRRCGYNKGREISKYTVWDIPKDPEGVYNTWLRDVYSCEGCFWSWVQGLEESKQIMIAKSNWYISRWGKE